MTIFEYFMVLLSVVLSLTLTQMATGVGELVRARSAVRWSTAYVLWLLVGLGMVFDLWTSLWLVRGVGTWSLPTIAFLLVAALAIYLFVLWLLPRAVGDEAIDLHQHLLDNRRLFLVALLAYYVCGVVMNASILPPEQMGEMTNYTIIPIATVLTGLAWWSPNRWLQLAVPSIILALLAIYFAIYFPTIG